MTAFVICAFHSRTEKSVRIFETCFLPKIRCFRLRTNFVCISNDLRKNMEPLKFVPLQVFIDPAFWAEVGRRRLDEWKLEAKEATLVGSYGICKSFFIV
jgi:hypothetical protein